MRPGADSLDRMGILRSWRLSSWLSRWARCREQPWDSYKHKFQALSASGAKPMSPPDTEAEWALQPEAEEGARPKGKQSQPLAPHCTDASHQRKSKVLKTPLGLSKTATRNQHQLKETESLRSLQSPQGFSCESRDTA